MNIAITGGTGFVGSHLAKSLSAKGHNVVLIARGLDKHNEAIWHADRIQVRAIGTSDEESLVDAFNDCEVVAHCAGINRELRAHDYDRIHVQGTRNVVNAAQKAGVKKVVLFALVGFKDQIAAPLAIEDVVRIMQASLVEGRLARQTVAILGPEKMTLGEAVLRVAKVVGKVPFIFRIPVFFHYGMAAVLEMVMKIPLVSSAQVRILTEGFEEPYGDCQTLPQDLQPTIRFTEEQIKKGLPEAGPFGLHDLRCWRACS